MDIRTMSAGDFRKLAEARREAVPGPDERRREAVVREIIRTVRQRGDAALVEYGARLDGVRLSRGELALNREAIADGAASCLPGVRAALAEAMAHIEAFHRRQAARSWWDQSAATGAIWRGQIVRPLDSVGIYVPGGTAAYPSTVLMGAVPARVAGVRRLVICTPPSPDGKVQAAVLAAAERCGVSEVYRVGGAQAVAAMAYGTETIGRVDKIVGPGNAYVTAAKRLVAGDVGIDMPAGPSEVLIIADETADPVLLAADLLAQAEHDLLAVPVLIATSPAVLKRTAAELECQLGRLPRRAIAGQSLAERGVLVLAGSLAEAVELAGLFAPEHLELQVADPFALLPAVTNAGSVFLGSSTAEAFGDYAAGVNHVLPTGGAARFESCLGVADFTVRSQVLAMGPGGASAVGPGGAEAVARASAVLARTEGLEAHARAVEARLSPAAGSGPASQRADETVVGHGPGSGPGGAAEDAESPAPVAREVFAAWGYRGVTVPFFLPLEDLEPGLGPNGLRDRLLKLVDPGGRVMVVRPDWTLPVARQAVAALRSGPGPLRLTYTGEVYRLGGRASAPARAGSGDWEAARAFQVGVELFGLRTTWADAELVAMAVEALDRCGLGDYTLCVGHAGFTAALLTGLGADAASAQAMRAALIDRNLVAWERLTDGPVARPELTAAARALVAHRSDAGGLVPATAAASVFGEEVTGALAELRELAALLASTGADRPVLFDLGLVRDLDYYTGVVFEAYASGCGRPVLTGGRYDGLLPAFGLDVPAVGLAIEVDALAEALAAQGRATPRAPSPLRAVTVTPGHEAEAFRLAMRLRQTGLRAELRPGVPANGGGR